MIDGNSSLAEFQELNRDIYLVNNDRNYSARKLLCRLHRHITQTLKAVRKETYAEIRYYLCMSFSWSMALANRFHINLADKMWVRFPGCCPYCLSAPCDCRKRTSKRQKITVEKISKERTGPVSLRQWQKMFADIYPNEIKGSAMHLAEEAGELDEAIENYSATKQREWFEKIVEELVDVVTNIFGVANCLKLDLADHLTGYFAKGCFKCHRLPCDCGFITIDEPSRP